MERSLRMNRSLAPVAVYTYSRAMHLRQTISALQENYLASQTVLYVVSDAPKNDDHKPLVDEVREYVDGISGFREVVHIFRDKNLGTPASILQAEEQIIHDHGRVISMEDDNLSSRNFLNFMNGGLDAYEDDPSVFSVCGYCPPISVPASFSSEYWFYPWNLSWGYAMWKPKYDRIYPLVNQMDQFRREGLIRQLRANGGLYIADALLRDHKKQRVFPDAVLGAKMTRLGLYSVVPTVSKIKNIGSDGSGVSGGRTAKKHNVELDDRPVTEFAFGEKPAMNDLLVTAAIQFYNSGLLTRLSRRLGIYHELLTLKYWLKDHLQSV